MNWLFLLVCATLPACRAEVIDRIAVVVGNGVITESELVREIRLTAFLNGETPVFTAEVKRQTANRLVEQRLMRRESDAANYPPPPEDEIATMLSDLRDNRFHKSAGEVAAALQKAGITEDELKAEFYRQLLTLRFIDFRFRPGIQIPDEEIQKYFDEVFVPQLKKSAPGQTFAADDFREQIEDSLVGRLVDKEAEQWLKDTKARTKIEFRPDVFGPEPKPESKPETER